MQIYKESEVSSFILDFFKWLFKHSMWENWFTNNYAKRSSEFELTTISTWASQWVATKQANANVGGVNRGTASSTERMIALLCSTWTHLELWGLSGMLGKLWIKRVTTLQSAGHQVMWQVWAKDSSVGRTAEAGPVLLRVGRTGPWEEGFFQGGISFLVGLGVWNEWGKVSEGHWVSPGDSGGQVSALRFFNIEKYSLRGRERQRMNLVALLLSPPSPFPSPSSSPLQRFLSSSSLILSSRLAPSTILSWEEVAKSQRRLRLFIRIMGWNQ